MPQSFKTPIEYISHNDIPTNIIKNIDFYNIYLKTFNPETELGKKFMPQLYKYTTTNKSFLKETQNMMYLKGAINIDHSKINLFNKELKNILDITNFKNHFQFIDFKYGDFLNKNENALQLLGIYNFTSPIINLITPIFIIIVPFFILKMKNIDITFNNYKEYLFETIFKKFNLTNFSNSSTKTKLYLCATVIFYLLGIYQNIVSCIKFYKNNKFINNFFKRCKEYFSYIENQQNIFINTIKQFKTYEPFLKDLEQNNLEISNIQKELNSISQYNIGKRMSIFYKFKHDHKYIDCCNYSLKFVGYLDNIHGLINNNSLNSCMFKNKTIFKNFYMPLDNKTNIVKNSCSMKRNYIISGPNASGKTTILKSILINIILSQQIGRGYYDKASIFPYEHIHCYLNIPDTNGRDSLFQAEARQCKDILDIINSHSKSRHFVIFDELYSGTNPEQAVKSAYSYLNYLGDIKNVSFILTTHFYDLCQHIKKDKSKKIINISMKSENIENSHKYFYKLQKGISIVKSGFDVLKKMNYPDKIISTLKNA